MLKNCENPRFVISELFVGFGDQGKLYIVSKNEKKKPLSNTVKSNRKSWFMLGYAVAQNHIDFTFSLSSKRINTFS